MCNPSCNCLIVVVKRGSSILAILWCSALGMVAQTAALTLAIEKDSVGLGEPLTLTLTSDEPLSGGERWQWPELQSGDTLPQGWEILSVGALDSTTSPNLDAGIRRSQSIVVLSWDTGLKVIEPFQLTGASGTTSSSRPQLLQVGLATLESNPAPKPLQGYRAFAWTWWERISRVLPWVLSILAGIGLLFWAIRKWRQREIPHLPTDKPVVPLEPAHVLALRILYRLKENQPWANGDGKETQVQLSEAVRLHLQGTFGVKALERATEELAAQLNQSATRGIEPEDILWLTRLLRQSDLVKFAKQSMGNDAHMNAVNGAIQWVERTRPQPAPSEEESSPHQSTMDHG